MILISSKKYDSKLDNSVIFNFRCEKNQKIAFQYYCIKNNLEPSAVARRMLIDFLKERGVEFDD